MLRAPSYKSSLRTFGIFEIAPVSINSNINLGVDLVNKDPIINIIEYLVSIIRVNAQSVIVGSPKLIIGLGVYNKD